MRPIFDRNVCKIACSTNIQEKLMTWSKTFYLIWSRHTGSCKLVHI